MFLYIVHYTLYSVQVKYKPVLVLHSSDINLYCVQVRYKQLLVQIKCKNVIV